MARLSGSIPVLSNKRSVSISTGNKTISATKNRRSMQLKGCVERYFFMPCILGGYALNFFVYKWRNNLSQTAGEKAAEKEGIQQKISKSFHESFGTYRSPRIHDDLVEWG